MNNSVSQTPNPVEMGHNNTARSEQRVIYRGDSGYNRQMATQIIDVNPPVCPNNNASLNPLEPLNINSINTQSIVSNNSTISPRSYDPEANSFNRIDNRNVASRWFTQTASRVSTNSRLPTNRNLNAQMFMVRNYSFLKETNFNLTQVFKRNFRMVFAVTLFTVLILSGYVLSVKLIDVLDKGVTNKISLMQTPQGSYKNAVNNQDLNNVIDELRMEIQKLKEMSYKNSVAISGLSNGLYKVPGAEEDSESVKRNKFGKANNPVNLTNTIHRQDLNVPKKRQENSEFVPGSVAYDASITLQS